MTTMLVQKANTINALMRVLLDNVESAPAGISSMDLRTKTGMNIHQYNILVGVLVSTKRIVNENNMLRAR
jgi:hypothetical protein